MAESVQQRARQSGKTPGEEVTEELSKELDKPADVQLPEERETSFRRTNLSRMRTEWNREDAVFLDMIREKVDEIIDSRFYEANVIMNSIYDLVRNQAYDSAGSPRVDRFGWPVWERNQAGGYIEDWSRLTIRERERLLYQITLHLFEWKQIQADLWAEAMFSKALWENAFSEGYESGDGPIQSKSGKDTIEARTARGRLSAQEERYFAIFRTYVSRRADAVVDSATLIGQRIKDVTTST